MPAQNNLFLLQDLDDSDKTRDLGDCDLKALRTVAGWIESFVIKPHPELGRAGPVCPIVPHALEHETLWLAAEEVDNRSAADVVTLVNGYKELLLRLQPAPDDDTSYKALVIVFSGLTADRARECFDDIQMQDFKRLSYEQHGVVVGEFHERNEGAAVRNPGFQPFKAPVPFLLMRHAVVRDWVFFLDNEDWFGLWARRFGESATRALGEKLRGTDWRHALDRRPSHMTATTAATSQGSR